MWKTSLFKLKISNQRSKKLTHISIRAPLETSGPARDPQPARTRDGVIWVIQVGAVGTEALRREGDPRVCSPLTVVPPTHNLWLQSCLSPLIPSPPTQMCCGFPGFNGALWEPEFTEGDLYCTTEAWCVHVCCLCLCAYICLSVWVSLHMHACVYVCVCVCVCVCV